MVAQLKGTSEQTRRLQKQCPSEKRDQSTVGCSYFTMAHFGNRKIVVLQRTSSSPVHANENAVAP